MLGTAFFAGLRSSGSDMKYSADCFYDDNRLMDVRVVSTLGLSQADLDDLAKIDGVLLARGGYTKEVLLTTGEIVHVIRLIAMADGVNDPIVTEGRLPENADECFIDAEKLVKQGLRIGDRITFESGDGEELSESLTQKSFTIVGSGYLPYYIDLTRGTGSIGDGAIDAFIILDPAAFDMDVYTEIYLRVARAAEETCFEDSYDVLVDAVTDRIDALAEVAVIRRYDEVYGEASEKLEDAKKQVADGEQELADAESEIADGHEKIADAEQEIADKEQEIADGWQEIADGRKEIDSAQTEINNGWNQISQAEKELEAGRAELEDARQQYTKGKEAYEDGKTKFEDGKKQYEDGKKKYEDGLKQYEDGLKQYEDGKAQYDAGAAKYEESLAKYEDGLAQYEAGKARYESGKAQYEAGMAEYEAGRTALDEQTPAYEAGKEQYKAGLAQYEAGKAQYDAGLAEYESGKDQYDAGVQAYEEAVAQLEAAVAAGLITPEQEAYARAQLAAQAEVLSQTAVQLDAAKAELDQTKAVLDAAKAELDEAAAGLAQYEESKAALDAAKVQLDETETQLAEAETQLKETKAQLAAAKAELDAGKAQLDDTKDQLAAAKAILDDSKNELDAGKKELDNSAGQLTDAEKELSDSKKQLDNAKAQIEAGEEELADGAAQIAENRRKLTDGQSTLDASKAELADGEAKLTDGEAQLADGKAELEDKKKELADAEKEFNDALPDARRDIQEGKDKIADGEKQLSELEVPEWYVLDRSLMESIISYDMNADRMNNLSTIFPVIFFLVAALVSLTAMTRMVDEQRMHIGTLKALGYSNTLIAGRYLLYAMMATVGGSIVGIVFGEWFLPKLIINSYGVMYTGQLYCYTPPNWKQAIFGIGAAALCTGGATLAACINQLRAQPASLMRPEAPAAGQRVFLERITPLWKHLNFTRKSTIRNLIRYKKRLIMTVIGVGGCMGLLLVGFGINDSITEIAKQQYINIFRQDAVITFESSAKPEERTALQQLVENEPGMIGCEQVSMVSVDLTFGDNIRSASLYIPRNTSQISEYLSLRDRISKKEYIYPEEGAVICEKTAKMLGLSVGDSVTIVREGERSVSVPVTAISENYILHYLFISPETYQKLYGREPEYNSMYLRYDDQIRENETSFGSQMMEQDACAGISFTTDLEQEIDDMLSILGNIVIVLIFAAGLLAFVVLYNLNSINIMERRRELATLKVLGFFDQEVAAYVYRENVILTVLGAALGILIGIILHRFVIVTVEVDLMMFGRTIRPVSYLYSVLLTFGFAVIVNLVMYYSLKKVDMIESLKSVE